MNEPAGKAPRPTPAIAAVILAGGRGTRLGGAIKANVAVGGVRLLERVAEAVRVQASPVLVAVGRFGAEALPLPEDLVGVADPEGPEAGPLAGLAAATAWCAERAGAPALLLSVAVDTPFFPRDFAARALPLLEGETDVVVAACGGQPYPTNALWLLDALLPLRTALGAHARAGIRGYVAGLRSRTLDWPEGPDGDPFANVNTPHDLAALEARALRQAAVHEASGGAGNGVGKAGQTR
jgi:molybdopterin-guanine dinucleotide biosynthesis protein A